jgi:hypothetical protein
LGLFFNRIGEKVRDPWLRSRPGSRRSGRNSTCRRKTTPVIKNRYSALIAMSSRFERPLRSLGIDRFALRIDRPRRHYGSTLRP